MAKFLKVFNLICTFAWAILLLPSLLWWKDSILWVILISIWANIVGHFSAYGASRAETGDSLTEKDKEWIATVISQQLANMNCTTSVD
jgi:hypothetical protein